MLFFNVHVHQCKILIAQVSNVPSVISQHLAAAAAVVDKVNKEK